MKELTKAEEQIMQILWKIERGMVNDVLEYFPKPKPAYSSVSTIIRILETKGFIDHKAYGKTHEYFPIISKDEYTELSANKLMNNYFEGSVEKMLSFFVKGKKIKMKEVDEILKLMNKEE